APIRGRKVRFTVAKTTDAEPCIDELEVYTAEPQPRNIALASSGTKASASSVYPNSEIHRLEHINDGQHGNSRSWISNERGKGWVELEFPVTITISRIVWARDREQKFADRLALDYRIEVALGSNDWQIVASSADRQPYVAGRQEAAQFSLAGLAPAQAAEAKKLAVQRAENEDRIAQLTKAPMIYGGTFAAEPGPTHRLHRGDPMQKREVVEPGALSIIPIKFDLTACSRRRKDADGLKSGEPVGLVIAPTNKLTQEQQRRLALAEWIADPANPLTA